MTIGGKGTADPIDKGLPFLRGVKKYKEYFIRAGEMEFTRWAIMII